MPRGGKRPGAGRKPVVAKQIAADAGVPIPVPQPSRKSKKSPPRTSAKSKLTPRQAMFLQGIAELKSQERAARDAGYSPSTARHAHRILEGANVGAEFQKILRQWVDPDKIGQRIAEGLDAMETKFFHHGGCVVDRRDVIAWAERRHYVVLAAQYSGYLADRHETDHEISLPADPIKRIEELLAIGAARCQALSGR